MSKPIRILHVIGKMDRAGAETLLMSIYRNIDRSKVQFDFIVHGNDKGDYDDEIKSLGGRIYHAPKYKIYNFLEYSAFFKKFFENNKEYSIIHGHMRSSASIYLRIAKRFGLYTICHSHNTRSKGIRSKLYTILTRNIPKYTDYFFGCSKQAIIDGFGEKICADSNISSVIYNGIELDKYIYNKDISDKYKKEFNLENSFVVGHIGRFSLQKNHKFLIDVFEQIKNKKDNAKLVLVGRGELEEEIKRYVDDKNLSDDVLFLGVRDDVGNLLMMFDCFIFPSVFEGLGIALIEAQATGLRCFVSEAIQKEAILSSDVYKLDLNQDPKEWADCILKNAIKYKRTNNSKLIKDNKYDIMETTKYLQKFYLNIK